MMNRENEEQKPVPQSLCGALQKEANCKCLVLSVLIYGCLAAVTWCRCANVSKIIINFSSFPIKTTKYVSPCDEGYIYIPVAFMGMLYLVYLVECYHSPIRIDLLHAEGQSSVLAKLTQLRLAQPTIWWKAISYHYVRRKRQVMRYRNGDNFTTTQVYYERVNSHAATSFYFYDYCGSKDISKELVLDPKIPITKITLSKGFAFSNVRSATEFEEARSRFFAEQEFRDDYMEMREGLDLGCNFSPMTLVSVLGNPWFTRSYVYWCLSALLLSWPLRIIIECNTQYVDYQVTKLFGVNYDTPTNIQIHTSASQLSAPGSYMLAPSYSEALLMEPSAPATEPDPPGMTDLVPSYSEALLYERANPEHQPGSAAFYEPQQQQQQRLTTSCECPCHGLPDHHEQLEASQDSLQLLEEPAAASECSQQRAKHTVQRVQAWEQESAAGVASLSRSSSLRTEARICESCLSEAPAERRGAGWSRRSTSSSVVGSRELEVASEEARSGDPAATALIETRRCIPREYSEPDLRRSSDILLTEGQTNFLRVNGRSLENIMENEENDNPLNLRAVSLVPEASSQTNESPTAEAEERQQSQTVRSTGAIPKLRAGENSKGSTSSCSRVTVNPIAEAVKRMPSSRSTYFCLKSILKQNRRRFTLVTPEELQSLTRERSALHGDVVDSGRPAAVRAELQQGDEGHDDDEEECSCDGCRTEMPERPASLRIDKQRPLSCQSLTYRRDNSRTLIFASPIQVVCPLDPFGGRLVVTSENPPNYEEALNLPVLSRLRRSLTDRDSTCAAAAAADSVSANGVASGSSSSAGPSGSSNGAAKAGKVWKHRRTMSTDPQQLASFGNTAGGGDSGNTRTALITSTQQGRSETAISLPSYDGLVVPPDSRSSPPRTSSTINERSPFLRLDELADVAASSDVAGQSGTAGELAKSRLRRSLTERRSTPSESRRHDHVLRKSFTERIDTGCRIAGVKRTNINIETSL